MKNNLTIYLQNIRFTDSAVITILSIIQ